MKPAELALKVAVWRTQTQQFTKRNLAEFLGVKTVALNKPEYKPILNGLFRSGQPTKLTDELLERMEEYLNYGWLVSEHSNKQNVIPSVCGLALYLKVSEETLYHWNRENRSSRYSELFAELDAKQKAILLNGGLSGDLNSNITKLVLVKHGYHDKVANEVSGPDGGPVETKRTFDTPEEIEAELKRRGIPLTMTKG